MRMKIIMAKALCNKGIDYLSGEYDISRTQLESDVDSLLAGLLKDGLVQVVD